MLTATRVFALPSAAQQLRGHISRPALTTSAQKLIAAASNVMGEENKHCYKYPRPSVTVDAAIVSKPEGDEATKLLLIQRKNPPCKGQWALPGGFVDENEPLDAAAARELQEETSVDPKDVMLTQVGAFGDPGRDPRGWCVTVAYAAIVPSSMLGVKAADDAADAKWWPVTQLPSLAFDHKLVVRTALEKVLKESGAASAGAFGQDLQKAVENLQGPWDPPKE